MEPSGHLGPVMGLIFLYMTLPYGEETVAGLYNEVQTRIIAVEIYVFHPDEDVHFY